MKTLLAATAAITMFAAGGSALASADLVKKYGCASCHDVSAKRVGPSWKEVAAKNKGDATPVIAAIEKGSQGKYGKVPMPPQAHAKGDAPALAKWILAQ